MEVQKVRLVGWALLLAMIAGCQPSKETATNTPGAANSSGVKSPLTTLSADDIWHRMLATYRDAKTYRDTGLVRLAYNQAGKPVKSETEVSVRFARPNLIRINAYQSQMSCDGKEIRARINDAPTNNVDNQFVARPAPPVLSHEELYGDELLHTQMGEWAIHLEGLREPLQLELLFSEKPFAALGHDIRRELLPVESIQNVPHFRLALKSGKGTLILWVDQTSFLVKRAEYGREFLVPQMLNSPDVSEVTLVAELADARINEEIGANLFSLDVPANAKLVHFFVPPPQPLPSDLFGKKSGNFSFKTMNGGQVTQDDFANKIAVLAWFNNYAACETTLKALQQVQAALPAEDTTSVLTICTEPSSVSDQQIRDLLKSWDVTLPVVRDLQAHGRDVFHIEGVPTVVILDREGIVQVVETGLNTSLASELPMVLNQIRKGESLAKRVLDQHDADLKQYAQQLAIASGATASDLVKIPQVPIGEKSQPKTLSLNELWTIDSIENPGNMLVLEEEKQEASASELHSLVVLDGTRAVVVLDREGKKVARHELQIPENAGVSYLRSHRTADGKRYFLGSTPLAPQVFVFDHQWQPVLSYPRLEERHSVVRDAWLADLDEDGQVELYVGFWGDLGVQRVRLDGSMEWSNRTLPSVMTLALTQPDRELSERAKLIVTGDKGRLFRLNQYGNHDPLMVIRSWTVTQLFRGHFSSNGASVPTIYCGIAVNSEGNLVAVALDKKLLEQWNYPLPPGLLRKPIEFVASGSLRNSNSAEWVFAAADGSVHVVSSDGDFADYFNSGEALNGIGVTRIGDKGVLLLTMPGKVSALGVAER